MKIFIILITFLSLTLQAEWKSKEIHSGTRSNTALAHDYDGDGICEIIYSTAGKTFLSSLDGKKVRTIAEQQIIHSELVDIDKDGRLDLVGAGRPVFWLKCPEKPWTDEWEYTSVNGDLVGTHAIEIGDIDKDGLIDIIAGSFKDQGPYGNSICWFKNPGNSGSWKVKPLAQKDAFGGHHYFDYFELNGKPALCIGAKGKPFKNGNYFAMWVAEEGLDKPWKKTYLLKDQPGATNTGATDLNGDGTLDFILANGHGTGVHIINGKDMKAKLIDAKIQSTHNLDYGDLDDDGDTDIVTCGFISREVVWYENLGNFNFKKHIIGLDQEAYDIRLVDLDGDKVKDVLVAGRGSNNVIWYKNPKK